MFKRQPDRFPLLDLRTPDGGRLIIGPSAVPLIVGTLSMVLVAVTLFFFGPEAGREMSTLLRALRI